MGTKNENRFFLELRFWERGVTESMLSLLARDFSARTLDRRAVDTESWVRMELLGDVRKVESLRKLGRKLGFYVGQPTSAVA